MTTDSVTRLNAALEGRYRIEREIGEGGMATVYLVMAVSFTVEGDTPRIGPPTELFRGDYYELGPGGARQYHIAPDGRFLMLKDVGNETASGDRLQPYVVLVQNFFEELRQVVPER